MDSFLDILFPRTCSICKRKGTYLCDRCKKLFKRNLPECYVCRRVSDNFKTHTGCMGRDSLESVFVSWEYSTISADLLKKFKYQYTYDVSDTLRNFFVECISNSRYEKVLKDTLIVNIPLSTNRMMERGFNQTDIISKRVSEYFCIPFSNTLLGRKHAYGHQALKDKEERVLERGNDFFIQNYVDISKYKSITIIDDVITTGSTLEMASSILKSRYGDDLIVNALCMFRGKPLYSDNTSESLSSSTTVSSV